MTRVAVFGCGSIGRRHLRNLALGSVELMAFDPSDDACRAVRADLGIAATTALDDLWAFEPRVAVIASSTAHHVALAREAVSRGMDIFVEKPLSHTLTDLDALTAEISEKQLISMVGCNMRFHPGPAGVKRLLEEGRIGAIHCARIQSGSYLPRWRPHQDYRRSYSAAKESGGAILDCIHELDLALWYLGPAALVGSIAQTAYSLGIETDGLAEMLLRHNGGAISNVHLNFVQRDYRRTCQMIGSDGTIYWDFERRTVEVYGREGTVEEVLREPDGWQVNQMYVDEMDHFLSAVAQRTQPMNSVPEAARTLAIALDVRRRDGGLAQ